MGDDNSKSSVDREFADGNVATRQFPSFPEELSPSSSPISICKCDWLLISSIMAWHLENICRGGSTYTRAPGLTSAEGGSGDQERRVVLKYGIRASVISNSNSSQYS
ncbi:hypothetical protein SK128_011252 [Halocaridina rubra]|uniref:Uncharacterized protein n=1 Tax=Halocaridina rubra TaxID=373956 RepID=A0AAN8WRA1_HALRR